jgi:GxxExxY protein
MKDDFPLKEETYQILGACFEVYNEMGCGFLESVYQECLELELSECGIPFDAQKQIDLVFKGKALQRTFSPDLLCFGTVVLELKAVRKLSPEHRAQVINYLKASRLEVGLLVNFGSHPQLEYERFVYQKNKVRSLHE